MLAVREVEEYLKQQVGTTKDIKKVWEVFKSFAQMPIEDEDDVELLFQCGISEDARFNVDFVRQFTVYDGEEYSHMEQLHCKFTLEPSEELKGLTATEWYFETEEGIEEYFSHIENLDEFIIPLKYTPLQLDIYQETI